MSLIIYISELKDIKGRDAIGEIRDSKELSGRMVFFNDQYSTLSPLPLKKNLKNLEYSCMHTIYKDIDNVSRKLEKLGEVSILVYKV